MVANVRQLKIRSAYIRPIVVRGRDGRRLRRWSAAIFDCVDRGDGVAIWRYWCSTNARTSPEAVAAILSDSHIHIYDESPAGQPVPRKIAVSLAGAENVEVLEELGLKFADEEEERANAKSRSEK